MPSWPAVGLAALAAWQLVDLAAFRGPGTLPSGDMPHRVYKHADWQAACEWAKEQSAADALSLTPRLVQTFKWYGERAEVVNWNDIPQDAVSMVEWWRRLHDIHGIPEAGIEAWRETTAVVDPERLRAIAAEYGVSHVLTDAELALPLPCPYRNATYAIYVLR